MLPRKLESFYKKTSYHTCCSYFGDLIFLHLLCRTLLLCFPIAAFIFGGCRHHSDSNNTYDLSKLQSVWRSVNDETLYQFAPRFRQDINLVVDTKKAKKIHTEIVQKHEHLSISEHSPPFDHHILKSIWLHWCPRLLRGQYL